MKNHKWDVDEAGVAEVCDGDEMTAVIEEIGAELAQRLNETSPQLADLKGSWTAEGREVSTTSSFWHWAEFGTIRTAPRAPVRDSMTALGFTDIDTSP